MGPLDFCACSTALQWPAVKGIGQDEIAPGEGLEGGGDKGPSPFLSLLTLR